jgi:hypothetical protein
MAGSEDGTGVESDVYVNGLFWKTARTDGQGVGEAVCFDAADRTVKDICIYLPLRREIQGIKVGLEAHARLERPTPFSHPAPLVVYGSSVAQGVGASRPGMSYAAVLARAMKLDFVNLAFGGAGKAEPEVVELVCRVDACCYILDLGKSYGMQSPGVYAAMLKDDALHKVIEV